MVWVMLVVLVVVVRSWGLVKVVVVVVVATPKLPPLLRNKTVGCPTEFYVRCAAIVTPLFLLSSFFRPSPLYRLPVLPTRLSVVVLVSVPVSKIPFLEWDPIPFWSSMEKKRYLQRKLGITRTM